MPQSATSTQKSRKILLPFVWIGVVLLILISFPLVIHKQGFIGVLGALAAAVALVLISAHPLVTFCLYFSALFFADTRLPGIPVSVNQVLGSLFLLAGCLYAVRGKTVQLSSELMPLLLAVCGYFVVNAALGLDTERGLTHMRYVIIYLVVTLVLAKSLSTERAVLAFAWIILGTTSIAACHGFWEAIEKNVLQGFTGQWDNRVRIKGTAKNAIVFAWNMCFAFPFAFLLYSELRTALFRGLAIGLGGMCMFAALLTFNRQTFVYIFIILLAVVVLYTYRNRKLLVTGLGIASIGAVIVVLPMMIRRLMTFGTITRDWSYLERRDSFLLSLEMIRDRPIFGIGLGSFPSSYRDYIPPDYTTYFVQYWRPPYLKFTDMGYLQLLTEGGAIGLLLFLLLIGMQVKTAWNYRKAALLEQDSFVQNLASTALVLLLFVILTTGIQDTFLYPRVWLIFSIVLLLNRNALPIRSTIPVPQKE